MALRVGDGSALTAGFARPVALLEFSPSNGAAGTTVNMASAGTDKLTVNAGGNTEGYLTRSQDGAYLMAAGFDAAAGTPNVNTSATTTVKRVVARVGANETVDLSTKTTDYSGTTLRSAATVDGSQVWTAGTNGVADRGLRTTTLGSTGAMTTVNNGSDFRVAQVFNNQIYVSTGSGIVRTTTGLPTTSSTTTALTLNGFVGGIPTPTNIHDFVLLDRDETINGTGGTGYDTMYLIDSSAGLYKFASLDGQIWTAQSRISSITGIGIEAIINGSSADIFATQGTTANNSLVKFTDTTNYDSPMGSPTVTTLATAGANLVFRGLALAPAASNSAPTITANPTDSAITYGQNTSFTATATGAPLPDVQWQISTDNGDNWNNLAEGGVYSGVTTTMLTLTKPSVSLSTAKFRAHFSNIAGTADSAAATLTVDPKILTATVDALNRVYDGTTTATVSVTGLTGIEGSDVVNVTATGVFANKQVATGKSVTITYNKTGADAANYSFNGPATDPADIAAKQLTATATATSKVYDQSTAAAVGVTLVGVVSGDTVSVLSATGAFNNKNVGNAKPVSVSGITLQGTDAGNYLAPAGVSNSPTANITALAIDIASATPQNKVYDGNNTAPFSVTLSGVISGDIVNGAASATFSNKNVGTAKPISLSGFSLTGADSGNYRLDSFLAPPALSANITAKPLTATATATSKTYNGNNSAAVTVSLVGVISPDIVSVLAATGSFNNKNVGAAKPVTVSGITLQGADATNYSAPSGVTNAPTADITAKALTATASVANKVYDGAVSAAATITLVGVVSPDAVTISGSSAAFGDKHAGVAKPITISGITISGADATNYSAPSGVTNAPAADITAKPITVTAVADSKAWDGTAASGATPSSPGVISGDTASFIQAFDNAFVGTGKTLTPSGVVTDGNGGANYSYTFVSSNSGVITATLAAPVMLPAIINGGAAQRSQVTMLTAVFSGNVTLDANAFTLENKGLFTASSSFVNQNQIVYGAGSYDSIANKTSFVITFSAGVGAGLDGSSLGGVIKRSEGSANSLVDGTYLLTVDPSKVHQVDGQTLGANNNKFGAAYADKFFRMFGDSDGDGDVDGTDTVAFRRAQAIYNAALDWDGNGSVTIGPADSGNFAANSSKKRRVF